MERLTMYEVIEHCKRKVQKIEAMFRKEHLESDNCGVADIIQKEYWEHRQVAEWLEQLKSFKDAEEKGLLLRLKPTEIELLIVVMETYKNDYPVSAMLNQSAYKEFNDLLDRLYKYEAERALAEMQKG